MTRPTVILHERRGHWYRRIRPRLVHRPVNWKETRSTNDLLDALRAASSVIALIDAAGRTSEGLAALALAAAFHFRGRFLWVDRTLDVQVAWLARELGATHVAAETVPPPSLISLLDRWITVTLRENASEGWPFRPQPEERDPIDELLVSL